MSTIFFHKCHWIEIGFQPIFALLTFKYKDYENKMGNRQNAFRSTV